MHPLTLIAWFSFGAFSVAGADEASSKPTELDAKTAGKVVEVKLPGGKVMKFCYCPAGSFTMGSPDAELERLADEDAVPVRLTQGFWMAQTECTQEQWKTVTRNNPSDTQGEKLPVEKVSWKDAQDYLAKLNEAAALPAGWKFALPSEAQWEYACRAGTKTAFAFGNSLESTQANFDGNQPYATAKKGPFLEKTAPVGSYQPNAWGLYDMHGNVWEWCADWYAEILVGGADPANRNEDGTRVARGGGWNYEGLNCRSATRTPFAPGYRNRGVGFRLVLVPSK